MSAIDRFSSRREHAEDNGLGLAFGLLVGGIIAFGLWAFVIALAYVVSVLA